MKKSILKLIAGAFLFTYIPFVSALDFSNYTPTLGTDSKYSLVFNELQSNTDPEYKFTYYLYDASAKTVTPVYYGYTLNYDPTLSAQRIDTDQGGINLSDHWFNQGQISTNTILYGGAIHNQSGFSIGNITGDFLRNHVANSSTNYQNYGAYGGAIYNSGIIKNILGDFIENYVSGYYAYGGAIYNAVSSEIGDITGIFIGNYVYSNLIYDSGHRSYGGAIYNANNSIIGNINGDFIGNYSYATYGSYGGAIYNGQNVQSGDINGNFIGNYTKSLYSSTCCSSYVYSFGGAIYNSYGTAINNINGDFIGNYSDSSTAYLASSNASTEASAYGGAIYNLGIINNINGNFINNYTLSKTYNINNNHPSTLIFSMALGGAIYNDSRSNPIENITGNFINNYASSSATKITSDISAYAYGGAIYNTSRIDNITGDFINNHVEASVTTESTSISAQAFGGAIYTTGIINNINGSFLDNYAKTNSISGLALGGAIYTSTQMSFLADGKTNTFSGNYTDDSIRGKTYNSIFALSNLTFNMKNDGSFLFEDEIETARSVSNEVINYNTAYAITLNGEGADTEGNGNKFFMYNNLVNIGNLTVKDSMFIFGDGSYGSGDFVTKTGTATTNLILNNGQFYLHDNAIKTYSLKSLSSTSSSYLHVNVDYNGTDWVADKLNIADNITGTTNVIVYDISGGVNNSGASVLFIDSASTSTGDFLVSRVYGSPYMWEAQKNINGDIGSKWYLVSTTNKNPDKEVPGIISPEINTPTQTTAEVVSYVGLHSAAIEQTRSMIGNVKNKSSANKILPDPCLQIIDEAYAGQPLNNVWVNPIYHTATIKKSSHLEANIWGLEAGFDTQYNRNHKIGVFASYRQGEYDFNGSGKVYNSLVGSNIDIESYIGGVYYRYDYRHLWTFSTLYGGIQKADMKTKDGIKADTDGTQAGGSFETGYLFNLSDTLKLEPSIGLYYTQLNFSKFRDNAGKTAKYDTIKHTEIEFGTKLEKYIPFEYGILKTYVKPSIIQVISNGDSVMITGLSKTSTYEDGTLGRMEIGSRYAVTNQLSAYGFANYTFGSGYNASSFGIGLNYAW